MRREAGDHGEEIRRDNIGSKNPTCWIVMVNYRDMARPAWNSLA